ncbi:PA2169 family four-helix-bundle protein [Hymenobacter psoromatis]|uniref:PA2169 family four-helix-bundle protein n=1 Tax=Hymenobacter psoromatis TaxID=1484116 RepID=UPI001CBE56ED|nr:PA2169 family four-helix-bundle protein [Hymenobacter psoromatis]
MKVPEPISDAADKAKNLYTESSDKAKDLYEEAASKSKDMLGHVPDTLKDAGDKTLSAFDKLTTTQKIVGGALLAAGLSYLIAPKKKGKKKRAVAALDELLLFVNDRIEGYKRAVAESKDGQLRGYYQQLVSQSQQFASSLNGYLTRQGGERETGTTLKGKLYRKFMDAQAAVTGRDEKSILAANVYGERWAIKAYKKALRRKAIKGEAREAIKKQFSQSKKTYKRLKELTTKQG